MHPPSMEGGPKEVIMPRKGSKHPYKARKEYTYNIKEIAELAGMTRNALNVAKAHGKIDPGDFGSVVSFLIRSANHKRLRGALFASAERTERRIKRAKAGSQAAGKKTKKTGARK